MHYTIVHLHEVMAQEYWHCSYLALYLQEKSGPGKKSCRHPYRKRATCTAHNNSMWSEKLKTVVWVLTPPAILLLALNKAAFVYRSYVTRLLAIALVAASAGTVIAIIKISNPSVAFMTGLLEGWMVIWSAVLLLHHNPLRDARRRRWSKVPKLDGEFEDCDQIWQRYPAHDWMCRLEWTMDLLLNFRGVGWEFGRQGESSSRKLSECEHHLIK